MSTDNTPAVPEPQPTFKPGDVVNGHALQVDGTWLPIHDNRQAMRAQIEAEVHQRTKNAKPIAWALWLFGAGFNAHLFYVLPRSRWAVGLLTVLVFWPVMFILFWFTAGLNWLAWWLLSAIPLLIPATWEGLREDVRKDVETDLLRRQQLYS